MPSIGLLNTRKIMEMPLETKNESYLLRKLGSKLWEKIGSAFAHFWRFVFRIQEH